MVTADFLSKLGLFVINNFLDAETCSRLISIATTTEGEPAKVTEKKEVGLDPDTRKTIQFMLDEPMESQILSRILSIKPELESHFHVTLDTCQKPTLLGYSIGHYFRLHKDMNDDPDYPQSIRNRQVSISILLNNADENDTPQTYSGGALTFYGLLPDPRVKWKGFPLQGEEGMLIAFSSRTFHEVQPITRGYRYSIVTWFV